MQITQLDRRKPTDGFYCQEDMEENQHENTYSFAPQRPIGLCALDNEIRKKLNFNEAGKEEQNEEDENMQENSDIPEDGDIEGSRTVKTYEQYEDDFEGEEEEEEDEIPDDLIMDSVQLYDDATSVYHKAHLHHVPHEVNPDLNIPRIGTSGGGIRLQDVVALATVATTSQSSSPPPGQSFINQRHYSKESEMSSVGMGSIGTYTSDIDEEVEEQEFFDELGIEQQFKHSSKYRVKNTLYLEGKKPGQLRKLDSMRSIHKIIRPNTNTLSGSMNIANTSSQHGNQHKHNNSMQRSLHSMKSVSSKHSNNPSNSFLLNSLEQPKSPRTTYLVGCAKLGVLPRASLVLRKKFTKSLDLKHQGIGDKMAVILAESIKELPYVQSINLKDNNLSCIGLCAIFHAVMNITNLLSLDIADNNIGPDSSLALGDYLQTPNCPLVRLGLQHADVDDYVSLYSYMIVSTMLIGICDVYNTNVSMCLYISIYSYIVLLIGV